MNLDNTSLPSLAQIKTFDSFRKNIFYLKADLPVSQQQLQNLIKNKRLEIDQSKISEVFATVFDKTPDDIIPITSLTTLHVVYKVLIDKAFYFIKINVFTDLYKEISFFQEQWISQQLDRSGVSYVQILYIDITREKFPFDFIILQEAKGNMLHNQQFPTNQEKLIFSEVGKYFAKIHTIRTKDYGPFSMQEMIKNNKGMGLHRSWKEFIELNLHKQIGECLTMDILNNKTKRNIEELFKQHIYLLEQVPERLLHNDTGGYNIFYDNKIISLIDWEDAISGDPVYDIANFGTFNYRPEHKKRIEYFLEDYRNINSLLENFEVKYWLYYLRIAIMKAVVNAKKGRKDNSSRITYAINKLHKL